MKFSFLSAAFAGLVAASPLVALTEVDITATIIDGPLNGTMVNGTISYNEMLLTGSGDETLAPVGSGVGTEDADFAISLMFLGETMTEENDVGFPDFPIFQFFDGSLVFIDYIVDGSTAPSGLDFEGEGIDEFVLLDDLFFDINSNAFQVSVATTFEPIPLPAGAPLLLGGLGAFAFASLRKNRRASS